MSAKRESRLKKNVEQEQRALQDQTRREQERQLEEGKRLRAAQEKEEARRRKVAGVISGRYVYECVFFLFFFLEPRRRKEEVLMRKDAGADGVGFRVRG